MAYLDDNPPASPQFREPRREEESGIVFVHSAESLMDTVGIDTGAENVGAFIGRRPDPGSYHVLVDSDSDIDVVRPECEAFQVGTNGHNRHAFGVAFACRSDELDPAHWWTKAAMARAGRKIVAYWLSRDINPSTAARWLTRGEADARRGPGLCCHGTVQPGDRSDAWSKHHQREQLEQMLVDSIIAAIPADPGPTPAPTQRRDLPMFTVDNAEGVSITFRISPEGHLENTWRNPDGKRVPWQTVIAGTFENLGEPLAAGTAIWLPVVASADQFGDPLATIVQATVGGEWTAYGTDELHDALANLPK